MLDWEKRKTKLEAPNWPSSPRVIAGGRCDYPRSSALCHLQISTERVGTVDKFQGQQAAIAIYSTATSSPADAPRGMEFLYSLNRLNVATSRTKRGGPGCLNRFSASISGASAGVRLPSGVAAG
jgi:hypothetical protein